MRLAIQLFLELENWNFKSVDMADLKTFHSQGKKTTGTTRLSVKKTVFLFFCILSCFVL